MYQWDGAPGAAVGKLVVRYYPLLTNIPLSFPEMVRLSRRWYVGRKTDLERIVKSPWIQVGERMLKASSDFRFCLRSLQQSLAIGGFYPGYVIGLHLN